MIELLVFYLEVILTRCSFPSEMFLFPILFLFHDGLIFSLLSIKGILTVTPELKEGCGGDSFCTIADIIVSIISSPLYPQKPWETDALHDDNFYSKSNSKKAVFLTLGMYCGSLTFSFTCIFLPKRRN